LPRLPRGSKKDDIISLNLHGPSGPFLFLSIPADTPFYGIRKLSNQKGGTPMNLQDFMFPICERPVAIYNGQNDITDWDNLSTFLTSDYKAIVRADTNEPISIVK